MRPGLRPLALVLAVAASAAVLLPAEPVAPPNEPAEVAIDGASIRIRYHGATVFDGRVVDPAALARVTPSVNRDAQSVDQSVTFHARRGGAPVAIEGTIAGSAEAFPVESDRPNRARPIVRHSAGAGLNRLNQAVYDRRWDWVLSVDDQPRTATRVAPAAAHGDARAFALEARGHEIVLRFRPRFFQRHRGLAWFEPWTYRIWPEPVVGWCSWFAFFDRITESDVRHTADVLAETLVPYGYEYLQIDDGYQQATGLPELWLKPNAKFPGGLESLAGYLRSRGLKPGIWTNATFSQTEFAERHPELFVRDDTGRVARGNWIDHPVDASAPGVLDRLVRPIYRGLREMGWEYFKLDALRHLRYEGYNSHRGHFARKGVDPAVAFRSYVAAVREEIGRDRFLLACWGVRPELVGIVDACRLGTDGYSYAGLAQYNSFNNVVWRNDPDHIELSDTEAWRSTMVTSLTGSLFLLTDRPERYRTAYVEPARRTAPVPMSVPGQLYDVDPSRSSLLSRADREVSGRDPKPFDASLTPAVDLFQLDVHRPYESWTVLGRTGESAGAIGFEDLGLDPSRLYLVFEFWQKRLVGVHSAGFAPGPLPARERAQAFVIREWIDRPQVAATGRHVTGGGPDLQDVSWAGGALSGRSLVVGGDPYEIYLTEAGGWAFDGITCDAAGATPLPAERRGGVVRTGCAVPAGGVVAWTARFGKS